jgi:hypothetical protein
MTFATASLTNALSTASFRYDPSGIGLKSTQQLNVDWSRFENHTFFSSAEAKVNVGFEQIINGYPFDGTRIEVEEFLERLTGYERWLFDQFPRYRGALHFSGTQVGQTTGGTYIVATDAEGVSFPDVARRPTGQSIIDPDRSSMTLEAQLFIPAGGSNDVQVVCQKLGPVAGFTLYLASSSSGLIADVGFAVCSGSTSVSVTCPLVKGRYNHLCAVLDRSQGPASILLYRDAQLLQRSVGGYELGSITTDGAQLTIGSGSAFIVRGGVISPQQTLSGVMDEFRLFHECRTPEQQSRYAARALFGTPELKLYYRFNEPAPPLGASAIDSIVLDSSGNSLHAQVTNFTGTLRVDAAADDSNPMTLERDEFAPVLFPAHADVAALNQVLLTSASAYDAVNPNLITRLVPSHYIIDGQEHEGLNSPDGEIGGAYGGNSLPGTGRMGSTQYTLSFLYMWSRFFDEMKLFVDAFGTLRTVDYDSTGTVPDQFLGTLVRQQGFNMPPLFSDASIEQYVDAENVDAIASINVHSLQQIRSQLLRRVLVAMPDIVRSKGTQHSIRSFLRAIGIDPDNSVRIREYGGPSTRQLTFARETKYDMGVMLPFGTSSLITSPFLSASRTEPGWPGASGSFVLSTHYPPHGISAERGDGLLTSGSWTVEALVRFTPAQQPATTTSQSIIRMWTTGSALASGFGLIANLVAVSSSAEQRLTLHLAPGQQSTTAQPVMALTLQSASLLDGSQWQVSFGCVRNDAINSFASSSYFVRAGRAEFGRLIDVLTTSSYFKELDGGTTPINVFRAWSSTHNASGVYLTVGAGQSIAESTTLGTQFLNHALYAPQEARAQTFTGQMGQLRFWSKALSNDEWLEHVRNPRSTGVDEPLVNHDNERSRSGSFGRLRLCALNRHALEASSDGVVVFTDDASSAFHLTGTGFTPNAVPTVAQRFDYSHLSPYFDEGSTNEKVRIRGLNVQDTSMPWAAYGAAYEVPRHEEPTDDSRFAIEFSLIDALNRDIMTLFSALTPFDSLLGNPELALSDDYPELERLRETYFKRLTGKLNFDAFLEFYRWFDGTIGTFIEQLVPRKTRFKGTNFVVESHVLERAKIAYRHADMYLRQSLRPASPLVTEHSASLRRY